MLSRLVSLAVVVTACSTGEAPDDEDLMVAELTAQLDSIEAIFAPGSTDFIDAYLQFFDDDVVLLPPGQPAIEGKGAIREFYSSGFDGLDPVSLEYGEPVIVLQGPLAVRRYTGRGVVTIDGNTLVLPLNRYVDVLRQTPNGWLILWHSWVEVSEPSG